MAPLSYRFWALFATQLLSGVASQMASYALRVWVFQQTGSVSLYAGLNLACELATLLVLPAAGWLADKLPRRGVVVACDALAALGTAYLALRGVHELRDVYAASFFASTFAALQQPAFAALVRRLVPSSEDMGRAVGMLSAASGVAQLVSPVAAASATAAVGLAGVLWLDLGACVLAVAALAAATAGVGETAAVAPEGDEDGDDGWAAVTAGLRYVRQRPALSRLVAVGGARSFLAAFIFQLIPPLLLTTTTEMALGAASSAAGLGGLAGALLVGARGAPALGRARRLVALQGLAMHAALLPVRADVIAAAGCVFLCAEPAVEAAVTAAFSDAPDDRLGRVLALRRAAQSLGGLLGIVLAGPLADGVFEPLMAGAGPLLGGALLPGPARGTALLLAGLGTATVGLSAVGWGASALSGREKSA